MRFGRSTLPSLPNELWQWTARSNGRLKRPVGSPLVSGVVFDGGFEIDDDSVGGEVPGGEPFKALDELSVGGGEHKHVVVAERFEREELQPVLVPHLLGVRHGVG